MVKKICLLTRCLLIRRLDVVLGQLRMGYMVYPKAILISSEPDKQETGSGEGFNFNTCKETLWCLAILC